MIEVPLLCVVGRISREDNIQGVRRWLDLESLCEEGNAGVSHAGRTSGQVRCRAKA